MARMRMAKALRAWGRGMSTGSGEALVGAIDQGTQSTRFMLFDKDVNVVASHQIEHRQIMPRAGWVEHEPELLVENTKRCIERAVAKAVEKLGNVDVKGVGVTNQRETTLVWDKKTGRPLHNAIVWLDSRTSAICHRMERELSKEHFRSVTGLPISTYFSAYKLRWMMENSPVVEEAVKNRSCMMGTVDSWLIYNLTKEGDKGGVHVTDVTNASRTNLMELKTCNWHPESAALFDIPLEILPEIKSNAEVYGHITEGPLASVPVAGCIGDQQAAALGQRCVPGEAKNTYGTGCFLLLNTGGDIVKSTHGLLTTVGFKLGKDKPTNYALEGAIGVGGVGVTWLKDKLNIIESAADVEKVASSVEDTAGVYFVPAFGGLLAPHWDEDARGTIVGLTQYTTKAHIARSMLEAICFQTREVLDAMKKDASNLDLKVLRVDGGASNNNLLMQMQADILGLPVIRPPSVETTVAGAAISAGLAVGLFNEKQIFYGHTDTKVFQPTTTEMERDSRYAWWTRAVDRSKAWAIE